MRTIQILGTDGIEDTAYKCSSGYGSHTFWLGFPIANYGLWIKVTNTTGLEDALEAVGKEVWKKRARLCRILRADDAYQVAISEYGSDIDGLYFPVNGGEHYINMPSILTKNPNFQEV